MVLKKDIRKRVLEERNKMSNIEWETNSHCICEKVVTHSIFLDSDPILCYMDYKHEVATNKIIQTAWELGKKVYVPKVEGDEMEFYRIQSLEDVTDGFRGILEPLTQNKFNGEHGLVIMPGVAFDENRNRIGYGKGYYDKYLERHKLLDTIAICFEKQMVEEIPTGIFDIKPEILITEEKIYD